MRTLYIVGAGPAGLMTADVLSALKNPDWRLEVIDAMPSPARKFLLAGKSGLNLSHVEDLDVFCSRYDDVSHKISAAVQDFYAEQIRHWAQALGIATFVGSSGKVFPEGMKAAPLLRAWVHELKRRGVQFRMKHRMLDWDAHHIKLEYEGSIKTVPAEVIVFALGGASWPHLGSDAQWVNMFKDKHIQIQALEPSNSGFEVPWSDFFRAKFAGTPIKNITLYSDLADTHHHSHYYHDAEENHLEPLCKSGEIVISERGIEGSAIYFFSRYLRSLPHQNRSIYLDLCKEKTQQELEHILQRGRGSKSWSSFLKSQLRLQPVEIALLYECLDKHHFDNSSYLAQGIKRCPLRIGQAHPIEEAISSAGGVKLNELDDYFMLHQYEGRFVVGEMLNWDAPTGGYLLTACFATGRKAALGVANYLQNTQPS